jgi:uncharacterized protein (TIGR03437 family)
MGPLRSIGLVVAFSSWVYGQAYRVSNFAGGLPRAEVTNATSPIGTPSGVGVDGAGNVYFASYNCIFKLDPRGGVTRIAGNYTAGDTGDGGPATSAEIAPALFSGMAVDAAGNVYLPAQARIRKISPDGRIATVPSPGTIPTPLELAVDGAGNLYFTSIYTNKVQKLTPAGVLTPIAGGGNSLPYNGGPALSVTIGVPTGVAADSAGNVYVVDSNASRVYRISTEGNLTSIAGTGTGPYLGIGYTGDGGPATSAQLDGPTDVTVDGLGNVYIASLGQHVRKVSPGGTITTVAGNGDWGYSGDGGLAAGASVAAHGIAADGQGNLYIADFGSNRIRKVAQDGTITTAAGNGSYGSAAGDGGPAANAQLSLPGAVALDQAGNVFIADIGNNRVRKVARDGTITTVAGNGNPGHLGDGGQAVNAEVIPSGGLTVDRSGNLYILDSYALRKVAPNGTITSVPGTKPLQPAVGPGTPPGTEAQFNRATGLVLGGNGLAADGSGNVFTEGPPAIGVDKIGPDGTISFVLSDHYYPGFIATDPSGTLFWTSAYYNEILRYSAANPFGLLPNFGSGCNMPLPDLYDYNVTALATDPAGNLYAGESNPNAAVTIRKYPAGGSAYRIYLDGLVAPARISGMAVDGAGTIYASDTRQDVVRAILPTGTLPTIAAVTNGASSLAGPIAPGEIVVVYGTGAGPNALEACQYGAAGLTVRTLYGTQVLLNGQPAPVLYTEAGQVAALVPYGISGTTAQVSVSFAGVASQPMTVPVAAAAPGLFTADSSGRGQAAAVNDDGTINNAAHAAKAGAYIALYGTGGGQTLPAGTDGSITTSVFPLQSLPVTVTIAGQTVAAQYAGGAPGLLEGVMQVNAQIPATVTPGNAIPVSIQVGGSSSQSGVTIAVAGR